MDFFEGSIFSPRLHLFDQSKNSNIVKCYLKFQRTVFYCNIFKNSVIYSCDGKAEFSASVLQSSVSHDPSEIEHADLLRFAILKTVVLLNIFSENCDTYLFSE